MKAPLSFYDEKYSIEIPDTYAQFKNNICSIFQFPINQFNESIINYIDADDDKIVVSNDFDYDEMKKQIMNNEVKEIKLEVTQKSNLYIVKEKSNVVIKEEPKQDEVNVRKEIDLSKRQLSIEQMKPIMISYDKMNVNFDNGDEKDKVRKHIEEDQQYVSIEMLDNLHREKTGIIFHYTCSLCKNNPIKDIIYICKECHHFICPYCENIYGFDHPHSFLKVRTIDMLLEIVNCNDNDNYINSNSKIQQKSKGKEKAKDKERESSSSIFNSIKNKVKTLLKKDDDDVDKDIKANKHLKKKKDYALEIQQARLDYDLTTFIDDEILYSLLKTNGNRHEAVIYLVSNFEKHDK